MPRWYAPCVHGALPVSSTGRVQGLRSQLWQKMSTLSTSMYVLLVVFNLKLN